MWATLSRENLELRRELLETREALGQLREEVLEGGARPARQGVLPPRPSPSPAPESRPPVAPPPMTVEEVMARIAALMEAKFDSLKTELRLGSATPPPTHNPSNNGGRMRQGPRKRPSPEQLRMGSQWPPRVRRTKRVGKGKGGKEEGKPTPLDS